jgi:hypothetical protein
MLVRVLGSILAALNAGDGVERGADGSPVAFRIWKAGPNVTDHGVHVFSPESGKKLLAEQAARGNLYSIDVDHMSLSPDAPPESRKAVGWHRLDVRAGELWAVDVQWTDAVRGGLTKDPPEWRYFSPAYDVAKKTGEIVSYANTALTNNPATWSVTALATATANRGTRTMDMKAIAAALFGDDDDKKKEARESIAKMSELEKKAWKAYKAASLDEGEEPKKDDPKEEKKAGAETPKEEPKEEKKAGEDPPKEEAAKAAVAATKVEADLLKTIGDQGKRLLELETVKAKGEIEAILAVRPDLTEKQLAHLRTKSDPKEVQTLVDLIEAPVLDTAAAAKVQATRGSHSGTEEVRASKLTGHDAEELAERFGRQTTPSTPHWGDGIKASRNEKVYPTTDKAEALKILAKRKASPAVGRPPISSNLDHARRLDAQRAGTGGAS